MVRLMLHKLTLNHPENGELILLYDTEDSAVFYADGTDFPINRISEFTPAETSFTKKSGIKRLKIQLGLKCNLRCSYCLQSHSDKPPSDLSQFLTLMEDFLKTNAPEEIQFWGGEPLLYWDNLSVLLPWFRERLPTVTFLIITNGTLLDEAITDSLIQYEVNVGLSHDLIDQSHREEKDPFTLNPYAKTAVMRLHELGHISVNAVMTPQTSGRKAMVEWVNENLSQTLPIGEGLFVDPWNAESGFTDRAAFDAVLIRETEAVFFPEVFDRFNVIALKLQDFYKSLQQRRRLDMIGQSCGMNRVDTMSVDLAGNVTSCQNVKADSTHKVGELKQLPVVALGKSARDYVHGSKCHSCALVQICKGGCMIMDEATHNRACRSKAVSYLPMFFMAFFHITGGANLTHVNNMPVLDWAWDV